MCHPFGMYYAHNYANMSVILFSTHFGRLGHIVVEYM